MMNRTARIDESEAFKNNSFKAARRRKVLARILFVVLCFIAAAIVAACVAVQFVGF